MKSYYFTTIVETGEVEFFETYEEMISFVLQREAGGFTVNFEIEVESPPQHDLKLPKIFK